MTRGEGYLFAAQIVLEELGIDAISPRRFGKLMNMSYQRAGSLLRSLGWVRCGLNNTIWYERTYKTRIVCNSAIPAGKRIARRVLEVVA